MKYDFSDTANYLDKLHNEKGLPGGDVIIYHKGNQVFRYSVGNAADDTIYYLYSCTKPITAAAGMQLIERGIMGLDEPVSRYIPAYGDAVYRDGDKLMPVGDKLRIRHLFTMSAGLNYNIESEAVRKFRAANPNATTLETVPAFIEGTPLEFRPGEKFRYSLCHDVLGAVIESATGMKFGEWLNDNIFEPLEMKEATFHLPKEKEGRLAPQFSIKDNKIVAVPRGIGAFAITPNYESGGAGLACTLADYGRFATAMSSSGVAQNGNRILKKETIDLLRTPQLTEKQDFGCAAGPGYAYGYGVRTLVTNQYGAKSHIGEFGWDGAAGSYILMDPDSQVAIVYAQQVLGWPSYFGCMHAPIRDMAYETLGL